MSLTPKKILALLLAEYGELDNIIFDDIYDGICLNCGEIKYGEVEPDARGYHCDSCGKDEVCGVEEALITML